MAAGANVHRTVAFNHLERLAQLGFLATELRRGRPGKPAKLYRASGRVELTVPARRFAELARLLAKALATLGSRGQKAARDAGRHFGDGLASLDDLGADYELEGGVITARNCVFREACDAARGIVCNLHAGLLETALRRAPIEPGGTVGSAGCRFVIKENVS